MKTSIIPHSSFLIPHLLLLSLLLSGCVEDNFSTTRASVKNVPAAWQPKRFAGTTSDFVFMAPVVYDPERPAFEEAMRNYPCISNTVQCVRFEYVKNADGTLTFDLDHPFQPIPKDKPFVAILYPRVSVRPREMMFEKFSPPDPAKYAAWLKAHPNFMGFSTCEYLNDIDMPLRSEGRDHIKWLSTKDPKQKILDSEFDELLSRPYYRDSLGDPKAIARDLIPAFLKKIVAMQMFDYKRSLIGEGTYCVEHLPAYLGCGGLGIETTRNYCPYQLQEMFCRGAARQFGVPWYWYIATYFLGYDDNGADNPNRFYRSSVINGKPEDSSGPTKGISLSAIERTMWKAWLSGAASYEREAMTDSIFERDAKNMHARPWKLSDEGLVYKKYYEIATTHDRGVAYTPIALLVPMARGLSRSLGRPFSGNMKCPYTHADHMTDAILATALDFPNNMTDKALRAGVERVMANSPYGDLFDAITPDFDDQTTFRKILPTYPCAILCGEYGDNAELREILTDYVKKGGTLVLSSAQEKTFPIDKAKLVPLANPQFAELKMGAGRVIVGKTPYLTAWEGATEAEAAKAAEKAVTLGEPQRFPDLEWLMGTLVKRFSPIAVKGNVQWGLNKVASRKDEGVSGDGWLIYLINNKGVIKFSTEAQEIQPGGSAVEIDLAQLAVTTAKDILTDKPVALAGGVLKTTVPYGGVQIIEVK